MDAGNVHRLALQGDTPVHRLPAHTKLLATISFVVLVVLTPRERFWAFAAHAALLAGVVVVARVPVPTLARRMVVEVPFLAFAVLMPFLAVGERVEVLGASLSIDGLYSAWNIVAKATLGVAASTVLAATTDIRELLLGLERLRMPDLLVQIMGFMVRYGDVVTAEMHRMRVARESRAFVARNVRQLPVVARAAGALFIRTYERGERVHLAMLSRGYTGRMPRHEDTAVTPGQWGTAMSLPARVLS
jgi:cobalt/nickel transport system permease protein